MAGVGKSAVAFTVAERMRVLNVREDTTVYRNTARGNFFSLSRAHETLHDWIFFATLAYQPASHFPIVWEEVNTAIRENPAVPDSDKLLRAQMNALFLRPLRRLHFRLRGCPPLAFVIDALDECTSETELADLVSLLGQALGEPDLPVTHILLASRSEVHIGTAIRKEDMRPLVFEIPVNTSGESIITNLMQIKCLAYIHAWSPHVALSNAYIENFKG